MQSHVTNLLQVALGLLKDVQVAYPEYGGVSLDRERLLRLVETRGLGVFTLDLPSLDGMLLAGLESGRLVLSGPLCKVVSKKIKVPVLFRGLWLRVFDKDALLRPSPDTTAIAFLRQLFCLGKKIEVGCTPERLQKTMQEYHHVEREIRQPALSWDADILDPNSLRPGLHFCDGLADSRLPLFGYEARFDTSTRERLRILCQRLQQVSGVVATALGSPDFYEFSSGYRRGVERSDGRGLGLKHGPGAVADLRGEDDKFSFPNWPAKLQHLFPADAYAFTSFGIEQLESTSHHEPPSKLIAVPKTTKAPRLIAAEPTSHQWVQQLVKDYLVDSVRNSFIGSYVAFDDQSASQDLVKIASRDRSLATLDLSSASDRLSCWAIERAFKSNPLLLDAFHACRTRWVRDSISNPPTFLKIKKFAAQGSALTFPVQTLFFLMCSLAVMPWNDVKEIKSRWVGSVRVFGDDIIIPKDGYADLVLLLDYLGLKVNQEKSFHLGYFRESCGSDCYMGDDITPVKPKSIRSDGPTARTALLDFVNNLFKKGYWHASEAALSTATKHVRENLPVVRIGSGYPGLTSFCGERLDHLRRRWNSNTHNEEVRVWSSISKTRRKQHGVRSALLQLLAEAPKDQSNWSSGTTLRPKSSDGLRWVPSYIIVG